MGVGLRKNVGLQYRMDVKLKHIRRLLCGYPVVQIYQYESKHKATNQRWVLNGNRNAGLSGTE